MGRIGSKLFPKNITLIPMGPYIQKCAVTYTKFNVAKLALFCQCVFKIDNIRNMFLAAIGDMRLL
jgi:hypothetical protein